jgi:hypothetical protein
VTRTSTWLEIYRWPMLLFVVITGGVLSALLGDDIWDSLSWLLLSVPLLVIALCLLNPISWHRAKLR